MDTITTRNGATLSLQVTIDDDTADTATLIVKATVNSASYLIFETANFVDGVADIVVSAAETNIPPGEYLYQITVDYDTGAVEKYPSTEDCDGDCDLPAFIVCDSLDLGVS